MRLRRTEINAAGVTGQRGLDRVLGAPDHPLHDGRALRARDPQSRLVTRYRVNGELVARLLGRHRRVLLQETSVLVTVTRLLVDLLQRGVAQREPLGRLVEGVLELLARVR